MYMKLLEGVVVFFLTMLFVNTPSTALQLCTPVYSTKYVVNDDETGATMFPTRGERCHAV